MFAKKRISALADQKRLLILEADLNRGLIQAECAALRTRLSWLAGVQHHSPAGGRWLVTGGALAGLLAVRYWRRVARWIPTLLAGWRWLRRRKAG